MPQPKSHLAAERARQRAAALQRDRERKRAANEDLFRAPPAEPEQPKPPRPTLDDLRAKYPDLIRAERPKHRPRAPLGAPTENLSARQVAIANERFALRDYERAGLEPVYSGGLLITLALAQRLGMKLNPRGTTNNAASQDDNEAGT